MGPLGVQEMIAIFVIALVLFGPKKLPELGRTLGKALSEFRRAKNELKATFESHLSELEKETRLQTSGTSNTATAEYSSPRYSYPYEDYNEYGTSDQVSSASQEIYESHATSISEPSTASATATQDAEARRESSSFENQPVPDTVPRSTGVRPSDLSPDLPKEEHPA